MEQELSEAKDRSFFFDLLAEVKRLTSFLKRDPDIPSYFNHYFNNISSGLSIIESENSLPTPYNLNQLLTCYFNLAKMLGTYYILNKSQLSNDVETPKRFLQHIIRLTLSTC